MSDSFVQVPPDSTGKQIATNEAGGKQYQIVNLADENGNSLTSSGSLGVNASNVKGKFRDAFEGTALDPTKWTTTTGTGDLVFLDGNTVGTSYLVISKSPLDTGSETNVETIATFEMPLELSLGAHMSQRTLGQEFSLEVVDTDAPLPDVPDIAISSISQATTTLTVNTATPHGLVVGKAIGIRGVSDSRLNFPQLVVATTPSTTQFTVTAGPMGNITSQTVGPITNGFVYFRERLGRSSNGISQIFENTVAGNASLYVRSASGDSFPSGAVAGNHSVTVSTTASIQTVNAALNYGFTPTTEFRMVVQSDRVNWLDVAVDTVNISSNRLLRTQVVPDPSKLYKLRIRTKNQPSMARPVARIVSAVKTGTTTATITTDVPHGLTTTSFVQVYGVRDQAATAFPNLTVATQVASVPTTTTFTIVIGTAAAVTSYGGFVSICNGTNLIATQGASAQVVQSVSVDAAGILSVVGSATWAGLLIGDTVQLHGVNNSTTGAPVTAGAAIDGAYKVANVATTTLTLIPIDGRTLTTLGTTNCGGGVIKRTDFRVSFVRIFDYERLRVESAPRAGGDSAASLPVTINGGNANVVITSGTVTSCNLNFPQIVADVASAALTTTATTAAVTPTFGTTYVINIPVTAVSGTNPTLDVGVDESDDSGTNWYRVYDFPRITATGMYRSPPLTLRGNRIRYVQTVGGTTPSFTRAINRLQRSDDAPLRIQFIDRSIVPNTLNSVTPTYYVEGCADFNFMVRCTAQTAPATLTVQFSHDGTNWHTTSNTLTTFVGIAHVKVQNEQWKFARLIATAAGTGITLGEAMIVGVSA